MTFWKSGRGAGQCRASLIPGYVARRICAIVWFQMPEQGFPKALQSSSKDGRLAKAVMAHKPAALFEAKRLYPMLSVDGHLNTWRFLSSIMLLNYLFRRLLDECRDW